MRSLFTVAVLCGFLLAPPVASKASGDTRPCGTYREAMEAAREALGRGDRAAALAALQKAKVALAECHREEAGITSLLAATDIAPRGA